jgi:hypothetical protein
MFFERAQKCRFCVTTSLRLASDLLPADFLTNISYEFIGLFHFSFAWSNVPLFDRPNYVCWRVQLKTTVFWDVTQCSPVEIDRRFGCPYCNHHQGGPLWNIGQILRDCTTQHSRTQASSFSLQSEPRNLPRMKMIRLLVTYYFPLSSFFLFPLRNCSRTLSVYVLAQRYISRVVSIYNNRQLLFLCVLICTFVERRLEVKNDFDVNFLNLVYS